MVGFENGSLQNDIAEGNILGSYGGSPKPSKARDFLGIEDVKLADLIAHVKSLNDESDSSDNGDDE